jgi:transketolase
VYLRTTREKTAVLYAPSESFPIGGSKVVHRSDHDVATVVAAGITVQEAIRAHQKLATEGIAVRIIDAYSIKPIDAATLRQAARETGMIITVEDHWSEGGLGEAVLSELAGEESAPRVRLLGVKELPGSGAPDELIEAAGISARHIANAVRAMIAEKGPARVGGR